MNCKNPNHQKAPPPSPPSLHYPSTIHVSLSLLFHFTIFLSIWLRRKLRCLSRTSIAVLFLPIYISHPLLACVNMTEKHVPKASFDEDDRVYCDNCNTSIVNFHRSCLSPDFSYDICLKCCRELRDGVQPGGTEAESSFQQFLENSQLQAADTSGQFFGWKADFKPVTFITDKSVDFPIWKANTNGSVPCPPKARGGCGIGMLELRRIFETNRVDELVEKSEALTSDFEMFSVDFGERCPLCPNVENHDVLRKSASRKGSYDNFLYCPNAIDLEDNDFEHFQMHEKR